MKSTRAQANATVVLAIAVLGLTPALATASTYLPVGDGVEHVYNGVPFTVWGEVTLETKHLPYDEEIILEDTLSLSPWGIARELHILQQCNWATNVPTGTTVGRIEVFYSDDSSSGVDLIIGVNTAEWAWEGAAKDDEDREEEDKCLQHAAVEPGFSWPVTEDWNGRHYYVSIPLAEKHLESVILSLDEESYTHPEWSYGCCWWENFGIAVLALTIEYPPIPATLDIDPDTLNLRSQGKWITAYLSLPDGYDVADIDSQSLLLNGEVPAAWSWIDEELQVLMVKFDLAAVAEILDIGEAQITVTGIVAGDTKFEGIDTVKVINPGKGKK